MSCPHVESLDLRPPQATQSVYREDCVQCFDSIDDTSGLDVCLSCFNGGCAGERGHNALHYQTSGHPLVLNIKRTRKHVQRDEPPQKLTKVAVVAETEADKYDTAAKVKCLACGVHEINQNSPKLQTAVDGVLKAMTFASQQEIKAWELELQPCEHTLCLQQHPGREIASQDLGHCSSCELKENLWLCLECGNLGCGRQQMGGAAGNSHGLAHATESGHGVAVKLGSITAEGTADVYCYICNDERIDTELTAHLAHWGINIAGRQKTEKSLMEMQVEHNLKYDFSMTTEDGKELKPLFGPGFTGIKNIGNTCYLASTMQCLFDLPEFQTRYFHPQEPPPPSNAPAEDLETQLRKIADGILSGRYSQPNPVDSSTSTPQEQQPQHQEGLNPAMFKHLVGRGHEEFSTMRQQDAFEFLLHLFKLISMTNRVQPQQDPVQSFRFAMEQRLQCIECKKVRYKVDEQDNISVPVPVRRLPATTGVDGDKKDEFESVSLKECLDIFTATDTVELTCPSCGSKAGFLKSSKFKTLPTNLAVNARRFELVNWVPTKLDIPVQVGDAPFDMSTYLSTGLQEGEIELPEETQPAANAFVPNEAAIGQLEMMGFPRPRCERALHATGNADAETAMNWLFAHMEDPDIDEPLVLQTNAPSQGDDQGKIDQLAEMGIGAPQARKALRECNGSVERAIDWVFSHPDDQGDFEADMPDQPTVDASPKGLPGSSDRPANYQLESIACHKGSSIHAGHYVAFVKREIPGEPGRQWVLYNDEKVVKAANIEEMKKFAYVYFFRRQ